MPIIQGNTQDSVKINGLTSRLIDRKAIKERGEVAQGCQEVGQSNRRLMPTWLQGLRRGIRSLLTSAWRSYESPNDLARLVHREGSPKHPCSGEERINLNTIP